MTTFFLLAAYTYVHRIMKLHQQNRHLDKREGNWLKSFKAKYLFTRLGAVSLFSWVQLAYTDLQSRATIRGERTVKCREKVREREREHRKLGDNEEDPRETVKLRLDQKKLWHKGYTEFFFWSPLWGAEQGVNRESGYGLKDWAVGDKLRTVCRLLQMPTLCAAMSVHLCFTPSV